MGRFLESREYAAQIFDLGKEAFDDMLVLINMYIPHVASKLLLRYISLFAVYLTHRHALLLLKTVIVDLVWPSIVYSDIPDLLV